MTGSIRICQAVLDAHAQFGGDLETMQKVYEWHDLKQQVANLTAALVECEIYLETRADADCDQDGFIPNEEMRLLVEVKEVLSHHRRAESHSPGLRT